MTSNYYTYAYLREDGTPYYIGKGKGKRAFDKNHNVGMPPEERILFLKRNLTEEEAHKHERYMIFLYGRKDKGTGILWNFTDGGEGCSGRKVSEETKDKIRNAHKGVAKKPHSEQSRKRRSEAQKGRRHSEETIQKLKEIAKNRNRKPLSEQHKLNISNAMKGKNRRPMTEENKQLHSERMKGNTLNTGMMRITNGIERRKIISTDPVPEGWRKGW